MAPMALYGKAYSLYNSQQYAQAADAFGDFIKKYNNNSRVTDATVRLADCYYGTKNYKSASNVYKDIFKGGRAGIDDPYAYYQYAQSLFKSGNTSEAINEFHNLQKKFPNSEYADKSLYLVGWINFPAEQVR